LAGNKRTKKIIHPYLAVHFTCRELVELEQQEKASGQQQVEVFSCLRLSSEVLALKTVTSNPPDLFVRASVPRAENPEFIKPVNKLPVEREQKLDPGIRQVFQMAKNGENRGVLVPENVALKLDIPVGEATALLDYLALQGICENDRSIDGNSYVFKNYYREEEMQLTEANH